MRRKTLFTLGGLMLAMAAMGAGCAAGNAETAPPADDPPAVDAAWLTAPYWDDGQAEVAFYTLQRSRDVYGRANAQTIDVGTYLVKHDFSPAAGSKATASAADAVASFKYALFYEVPSGSYEYKRAWVVNARQRDLAPLKASFTMFDWCANVYRESVFEGGRARTLFRSDDYGNGDTTAAVPAGVVPVAALPLFARAVDLSAGPVAFSVLTREGAAVRAEARLDSAFTTESGQAAEAIAVTYARPVHTPLTDQPTAAEVFWRGPGPDRLLLRWAAADGAYALTLTEALRSPYWQEDVYERLERVTARP